MNVIFAIIFAACWLGFIGLSIQSYQAGDKGTGLYCSLMAAIAAVVSVACLL